MATAQSERHFLWLIVIVLAVFLIVIELILPPPTFFKLGVCAASLLAIGVAWFKRARNRRHDRT